VPTETVGTVVIVMAVLAVGVIGFVAIVLLAPAGNVDRVSVTGKVKPTCAVRVEV
jgi:hypothetical protein